MQAEGEALVVLIREMEAQLTVWEDAQPTEVLELLPWWEARKAYREQKALGNVPEVTWWEAVSFLEQAYPTRIKKREYWGLRRPK